MIENKDGEKILMDTEARIAIRGNVEVCMIYGIKDQ